MTERRKQDEAHENVDGEDVITIRGKEIRVRTASVDHKSLKFYSENPRIYSIVWEDEGATPTQQQIYEALARMEHVRESLVPSIRQNGGLIEPLLIRGRVVLEGNSRLAAYRILASTDADRWEKVRVRILPDDITESEVFTLLGEFHIVGKKDWQPFEQAGYLYRRFKKHQIPEDELSSEVGLGVAQVRHLIRTYEFMLSHADRSPNRWSYYDQLLKGRRFNKARELYPTFDEVIVDKIKSEEIERAVDLRDQLPLITNIGGNTLRKFIGGKLSFEDAVQDAKQRGAGDYNYKKLNQFRQWLAEESLDSELADATPDEKKRLRFEFDKIARRVRDLQRKVE